MSGRKPGPLRLGAEFSELIISQSLWTILVNGIPTSTSVHVTLALDADYAPISTLRHCADGVHAAGDSARAMIRQGGEHLRLCEQLLSPELAGFRVGVDSEGALHPDRWRATPGAPLLPRHSYIFI